MMLRTKMLSSHLTTGRPHLAPRIRRSSNSTYCVQGCPEKILFENSFIISKRERPLERSTNAAQGYDFKPNAIVSISTTTM